MSDDKLTYEELEDERDRLAMELYRAELKIEAQQPKTPQSEVSGGIRDSIGTKQEGVLPTNDTTPPVEPDSFEQELPRLLFRSDSVWSVDDAKGELEDAIVELHRREVERARIEGQRELLEAQLLLWGKLERNVTKQSVLTDVRDKLAALRVSEVEGEDK